MTYGKITCRVTCDQCNQVANIVLEIHGPMERHDLTNQAFEYLRERGWGRANVGDWIVEGPKYHHYCPQCWLERRQSVLSRELDKVNRQLEETDA